LVKPEKSLFFLERIATKRHKRISGKQGIRMWISGYQSIRLPDIRGTGISKIVHAPNFKNKIGAGSALILSLRNSGENPKRINGKKA